MLPLLLLLSFFGGTSSQFAEIASLATSLLGSGLGAGGLAGLAGTAGQAAGAAGQAGGALAQIGQLYQLAQGALQLTGTGVGVLNQASEGNWFPAVLEHAAKNTEMLRSGGGAGASGGLGGLGGLMGLGPLSPGGRPGSSAGSGTSSGLGPEFGTNFPAPDVDDYTDSTPQPEPIKAPIAPTDFDDKDLESSLPSTTTGPSTTSESVTLFPDEDNSIGEFSTEAPQKQIRIQLPKREPTEGEEDYEDKIASVGESAVETSTKKRLDGDENLLQFPNMAAAVRTLQTKMRGGKGGVPDLTKLIDVLRKSNLKEEEIMEIVDQVEGNEKVEKPPKIDFTSGVQNIGEKKALNRERIVKASRELNTHITDQNKNGREELTKQVNELRQLPDLAVVTLPPTAQVPVQPYIRQVAPALHQVGLPYQLPHLLAPHADPFLQNNRLQREIQGPQLNKDNQGHTQQIAHPQVTNNWQTTPQAQHGYTQPQTVNLPLNQFQQQQLYHQQLLHQALIPNYNQQAANYNQQAANYAQQAANYNRQAAIYNQQAPHYNGANINQQTQYQRYYYSTQQQQPAPQYRQFQQVAGDSSAAQARSVVYTNQNGPNQAPFYNQAQKQTINPQPAQVVQQSATNPKVRSAGYTTHKEDPQQKTRHLRESHALVNAASPTATQQPTRRFPARTARVQPLTTPAPVGGLLRQKPVQRRQANPPTNISSPNQQQLVQSHQPVQPLTMRFRHSN